MKNTNMEMTLLSIDEMNKKADELREEFKAKVKTHNGQGELPLFLLKLQGNVLPVMFVQLYLEIILAHPKKEQEYLGKINGHLETISKAHGEMQELLDALV